MTGSISATYCSPTECFQRARWGILSSANVEGSVTGEEAVLREPKEETEMNGKVLRSDFLVDFMLTTFYHWRNL